MEAVLQDVARRFQTTRSLLEETWQFALRVGDLETARRAIEKIDQHPFEAPDDDQAFRRGVLALWSGDAERARRDLSHEVPEYTGVALDSYETGSDSQAAEIAWVAARPGPARRSRRCD
jgi:hypothetical protein